MSDFSVHASILPLCGLITTVRLWCVCIKYIIPKTITKIDGSTSLWQADYFDGLGRVIQSQSQGESGYTIISKTTTYNNCGQVANEYVSQNLNSYPTGYVTPDSSWKCTSYVYDGLGRVTTQTNADGTTVTNDYSTAWQNEVTNERGNISNYTYDAFGRLIEVQNFPAPQVETNPATNITGTSCTLNGTLDSLGTASSANISFDYGPTTGYGSTVTAAPSSLTAPGTFSASLSGLTTGANYHFRAKAVGVGSTGASIITTYVYDVLGNLKQVTDSLNNTSTMNYDWLSRKTGMTDPDMGTWSYKYDANGNLTSQTDNKTQTTRVLCTLGVL